MELYNGVEVEDIIYDVLEPFIRGLILSRKKGIEDKYLDSEFVFDNARFVFKDNDIEKIRDNLERYCLMNKEDISFVINELKKSSYEYYNESQSISNVYIKVDDCDEFFYLLYKLYDLYYKIKMDLFQASGPYERIRYLWLRMGVNDVKDVIKFLKKEIAFAMNCAKFEQYPVNFGTYNGLEIYYENKCNFSQFETNSHILFSFRTKFKFDDGDLSNLLDKIDNQEIFELPVVHYGLIKDNNVPTCYIYGIQNLPSTRNNELLPELKSLRNSLFNNNVSPFFIISLKLFIDLLASRGIYIIKVPLMQVFNYDFHEFLGKSSSYNLDRFLASSKDKIDNEDDSRQYEHLKKQYKRFYDKEDLVSFNKTERLIYTFMELEERFKNIEILNEPFRSGEYLLIKIKPRERSMYHFEELQLRENKRK